LPESRHDMLKNIFFCFSFIILQSSFAKGEGYHVIADIIIKGNNKTKEKVILRELNFVKGDTINNIDFDQRLKRSRDNLLNTSLFNYVTITPASSDSITYIIEILVEERWYLWPAAILKYDDRNFSAWLKEGDLSRSKYGVSVEKYNCFGLKESLKFSFFSGYARQFAVSYKGIPVDRSRKHFIGADFEITRQDEIIYKTVFNEPATFNNSFNTVYEKQKYTLNYLYRPRIYNIHNFYFNYIKYSVADTLITLNPSFLLNNQSKFNCYTLDYVYTNDHRDIKAYPLKGSYFEMNTGITLSTSSSATSFTSISLVPVFYRYFELSRRLHYAAGINMKISFSNHQSYIYSRSLGYSYNLHGFEYNTIEGQHFMIVSNLLKFTLLSPKVSQLKFIPFRKFNKIHYAVYMNLFNDLGYVSDKYKTIDNSYSNKLLASIGAGLDLVTYYDKTFRFEYSVNGFGKSGIYLHLTAPLNKQ
jgi:outer membrane protein assembly factor BamA